LFFTYFILGVSFIAIFLNSWVSYLGFCKACIYRTHEEMIKKISLSKLIDKYLSIRLCISDIWMGPKEI